MASTKEKKHLRRRSNWYIYLISFAATTVLLLMFIFAIQEYIFPNSSNGQTNVSGFGAEYDTTVLFMMGEEKKSVPDSFMLMNYRPRDGAVSLVPLNSATRVSSGAKTGKLTDLYKQGGAASVTAAIKETLGVECDFFVQFDRASFVGLTTLFGDFRVNVPYYFEGGGIDLHTGEHFLPASDFYLYMNNANFADVDAEKYRDYKLEIMGTAMKAFINENCRNLDAETIQKAFTDKLLNNVTTDLSYKDFTYYQPALLYTSENSISPANYYVPMGAYDAEEFVISQQSIAVISDRFGIIG